MGVNPVPSKTRKAQQSFGQRFGFGGGLGMVAHRSHTVDNAKKWVAVPNW